MYKFGCIILWNCPFFSLRKKVSGIHTFFESVMVKYFILPLRSLKARRLSFHCWRKVIWTLYSCKDEKVMWLKYYRYIFSESIINSFSCIKKYISLWILIQCWRRIYVFVPFKNLKNCLSLWIEKYFLSCLNVRRQTIYAFVTSYVVCCMIGFDWRRLWEY